MVFTWTFLLGNLLADDARFAGTPVDPGQKRLRFDAHQDALTANVHHDPSAWKEANMERFTPDFSLDVQGVKGVCPAGEVYAKQQIARNSIPVFSCEGPCIRGDIARLAANLVSQEVPSFARACHAETFVVPHSTMARWVKGADKVIMIDGCFLLCHGRILKKLTDEEKVVHIDALPLYKKYTDIFLMDDVPEDERKAVAREVADKIIARLKDEGVGE